MAVSNNARRGLLIYVVILLAKTGVSSPVRICLIDFAIFPTRAAKFKAISHLLDERKWNAALLTDVKFPEDGFREFYVGQGWKPGLLLIPVYAPLSNRRPTHFSQASWLAYTDHNPVELIWTLGKDWQRAAARRQELESRPDVLRLLGSSATAQHLRESYTSAVSLALADIEATSLDWDTLTKVMCSSALKVLGPVPKRKIQPWFQGKERELRLLENDAHEAELQLHAARRAMSTEAIAPALRRRRETSRCLQQHKRQWEAQWWDDLAERAMQAGSSGNDFAFWQVCRQLGMRDNPASRAPSRRTVADPELDREAWRTFLAGIQTGAGEVDPSVWQFVPSADSPDMSLATPPSWSEFLDALAGMHNGKRGGCDNVTVELIRYGGSQLQQEVFKTLLQMWSDAATAVPGHEADSWSPAAKTGICIPVFKNKGDRADRKNYRNLVMLSVAAKLIARIAATRLSEWAEQFMAEEQQGFRKNRGIDDAHQLARRIIEEVILSRHSERVAVTSFDIVRAYTRVCRLALWRLLDQLGVPPPFLQVLRALHDHTSFKVFIHNGYSTPWLTDRGLREGCPSSPVLFNLFHSFVMRTFRARRQIAAQALNRSPGLPWQFKVDGRLTRRPAGKTSSRGVEEVCLGDLEYADDTQIFGFLDEVSDAELIFSQTLADWEQQEHLGKRETLILCSGGRSATEVLSQFERRTMKHLGAFLNDCADYWPDTKKRVQAGFLAVKRIARLWRLPLLQPGLIRIRNLTTPPPRSGHARPAPSLQQQGKAYVPTTMALTFLAMLLLPQSSTPNAPPASRYLLLPLMRGDTAVQLYLTTSLTFSQRQRKLSLCLGFLRKRLWALYTDGAGPSAGHPHAGWGVAIWESAAKSHLPDFELFGPVPLDPRDKRWLGASVATNNTGELTAMVEALLWLEQEAPGAPDLPAIIWFDSTYAHDVLTGTATPTANQELIDEGQRVLERVKTKRLICWAKVRGHSGNLGNDYADHLAEQGATGKQTRHSARWLLPMGAPEPVDPLLTDSCWRCGRVFTGASHARQLVLELCVEAAESRDFWQLKQKLAEALLLDLDPLLPTLFQEPRLTQIRGELVETLKPEWIVGVFAARTAAMIFHQRLADLRR
ncbi:LINE-1 retrotransposable element ORF2 protein (ORF2p) [Includes: Reverse transcriptase [Durusdinium trenchii]|uniref:LINE-1 retrotransposable element ORF2 protein (ORF2p) n=1 Tax=Durusdinium trenchii TaxID=1381693 RepID=A0ABP0MZD1_9DINO